MDHHAARVVGHGSHLTRDGSKRRGKNNPAAPAGFLRFRLEILQRRRARRTLALPHDWSIEGPFDEHEPTGGPGGYLPTGIGWYRKRFRAPENYRSQKVSIEFDGVYQNSEVWINGHYLGKRPYGYISFACDLTPYLLPGANVLAVRVDNSHQ